MSLVPTAELAWATAVAISIGPAASGRRKVPLKGERENSNQAILREQALDDLSMLLSWKEKTQSAR